jgi:hypothetical protein
MTVIAIAVIAYAGVNICHEILGHCTMALLVGTKCRVPLEHLHPLATELPTWKYNMLVPAGITANWIAALACFVLLRRWKSARPTVRYFLWLLMAVNLFLSSTYMAVAPIIKFGDSYILIQGAGRGQFFVADRCRVGGRRDSVFLVPAVPQRIKLADWLLAELRRDRLPGSW